MLRYVKPSLVLDYTDKSMSSLPMDYRLGTPRLRRYFERSHFAGLRRETSYRPVDRADPNICYVRHKSGWGEEQVETYMTAEHCCHLYLPFY